jgi:hypothetical protein
MCPNFNGQYDTPCACGHRCRAHQYAQRMPSAARAPSQSSTTTAPGKQSSGDACVQPLNGRVSHALRPSRCCWGRGLAAAPRPTSYRTEQSSGRSQWHNSYTASRAPCAGRSPPAAQISMSSTRALRSKPPAVRPGPERTPEPPMTLVSTDNCRPPAVASARALRLGIGAESAENRVPLWRKSLLLRAALKTSCRSCTQPLATMLTLVRSLPNNGVLHEVTGGTPDGTQCRQDSTSRTSRASSG